MRDVCQRRRCGFASAMLGAACSIALLGCTTDDLDRLGAGRAPISSPSPVGDGKLEGPLYPDGGAPDAGAPALTADAAAAPAVMELLPDPSFESGHAGWEGFGGSSILDVAVAHSGSRAILSTNRSWSWEGPSYDIRPLVVPGQPYAISAWVRNELGTHNIMFTLKTECGIVVEFTRLATRAVADQWLQLDASFLAPDCAELDELTVYIEGPPSNKNVLVDDVSLRAITLSSGAP